MKNLKKILIKSVIASLVFLLVAGTAFVPGTPETSASANLVKEASFEGDIFKSWGLWKNPDSSREYNFFRSYDAPFGNGSFSAAVTASGNPGAPFDAILSTIETNRFPVAQGRTYYLFFYAKATTEMDVLTYLQRATDYNPATPIIGRRVNTVWQRFTVTLEPQTTSDAFLAFTLGDMPDGATFYLDGIQLFEANQVIGTPEIKGGIGDTNKLIRISNIGNFSLNDFRIELPYFDNLTGEPTTKNFPAKNMTSGGIYFDMPEQTFSGVGKVFASDAFIGLFDYNVAPKVTDFYPSLVRASDDLVIFGSGFSPVPQTTFLVVSRTDLEGRISQIWLTPASMDSKLSQMVFNLPYGIVSGSFHIQTSFMNTSGSEVVNRSNNQRYSVKPVVFSGGISWRDQGYEIIGDTVQIHGKGFGNSPVVNFYDDNGIKVDSKKAKLVQVEGHEIIEVQTSNKFNSLNITITAGGVESDPASALSYTAKPKMTQIKTKYSRPMYGASDKLPAAKVGDEITISGEGFARTGETSTMVEFQGLHTRITVEVPDGAIDRNGRSLKVTVPSGAQNGYLGVRANSEISNYLPMEIIPTVYSISPAELVPGEEMVITAEGVGDNLSLIKIYFQTGKSDEIMVSPDAVVFNGVQAHVRLKTPFALSSRSTAVSLQYDRWRDDGSSVLNIAPTITGASIDMDSKILVIRGYGFSINPRENVITYRYADENRTVINPRVRMLGVYPTEEGQEIRIQIQDDYHFGYVSVKVGDYQSNEANFGPVSVRNVARRVEFVRSLDRVTGVLYISGYNFGSEGGVRVGTNWADIHYRSEFFIIAVIDEAYLYDNPVIVTRQ